jgi:hypothetical protein
MSLNLVTFQLADIFPAAKKEEAEGEKILLPISSESPFNHKKGSKPLLTQLHKKGSIDTLVSINANPILSTHEIN